MAWRAKPAAPAPESINPGPPSQEEGAGAGAGASAGAGAGAGLGQIDRNVLDTSPMAGLGFGLPVSRLYAQYFGGDVQLVSMEGHGKRLRFERGPATARAPARAPPHAAAALHARAAALSAATGRVRRARAA